MKRAFSILTLFACAAAHAQLYHLYDLGALPGGYESVALGVNATGQVVGYSSISQQGYYNAFLYSDGQLQNIGALFYDGTPGRAEATGINASGSVVGYSFAGPGDEAFVYTDGVMAGLGFLGAPGSGPWSAAYSINSSGVIVGASTIDADATHAFYYSDGSMHDLGTLSGDSWSGAYGINDSGQIVGYSYSSGDQQHAFLYTNGTMTNLGSLGGPSATAYAINNLGQVVGTSETVLTQTGYEYGGFLYSNGQMQQIGIEQPTAINDLGQVVGSTRTTEASEAFLYSNGATISLNTVLDTSSSGYYIEQANGINNSGTIVGLGVTPDGQEVHAVLLAPLGLPASYSLIVGIQAGGGLNSLYFNDSSYLLVQRGVTINPTAAPIQVQVSSVSTTLSPNSFQFKFVGHVSSTNLSQSILLYNFNTSAYETISTTSASLNADSTVTVTGTGTLSRYVNQSTGEVRARVNFTQTGPTSVYAWTASLGQVNWTIQ